MAQWLKALAILPDGLSLIPETHMQCKLLSDFHVCAFAHMPMFINKWTMWFYAVMDPLILDA